MKIAIYDDDDAFRELIHIYLEHHHSPNIKGYDRYTEPPEEDVDVFMLDYDNPYGVNGAEFLRQYKDIITSDKRILMSGAYGWQNSGLDGILLQKPFELEKLGEIIEIFEVKNGYTSNKVHACKCKLRNSSNE